MSNWLDVRIKLLTDAEDQKTVHTQLRNYFFKETRRDKNAAIFLGSNSNKFVWCSIKSINDFNSIIGYTKVGFHNAEASAVINWLISKFPCLKSIAIQTRDDRSRIFSLYKWSKTENEKNFLALHVDPEQYPVLSETSVDSYNEETSKKFGNALKHNSISIILPVNWFLTHEEGKAAEPEA